MTHVSTTSHRRNTLTAAVVGSGLLVALMFSGCGSSTNDGSTTTTTVSTPGSVEFRPVLAAAAAGGTCDVQSSIGDADTFLGCKGGRPVTYTLGSATTISVASARAAKTGTGEWAIAPVFTEDAAGIDAFNALAAQCYDKQATCPTGELAIVVDGRVLSAPTIQTSTFKADQVQITGNFDEAGANSIAEQLMTNG
jgi:preprotein translocase subunit SecD